MAKLQLVANPTFKAKVAIPVAGGESVAVEFEFKHRTKTALDAFIKKAPEFKDDTLLLMECVVGWDLADAFTKANVKTLLENYIGAGLAVYDGYLTELVKAKEKN